MADKYRVFSGVIYPDSTSYDYDSVLSSLKARFKEWAYCLHDSDVNDDGEQKKAHVHWVARGRAGTDMCPMEKSVLNVDNADDGERLIRNKIKSMMKG